MLGNSLARMVLAGLLGLGLASSASGLTFFFDGYGGFTDPGEISPETPDPEFPCVPSPVNSDCYEFEAQNAFDTDVTSWQHFGWGTPSEFSDMPDHSHATVNDTFNDESFLDHVAGGIEVNGPGNSIGWLTHYNYPISAAEGGIFGPSNVALHYHLDIYADAARTELLFESGPRDFTVEFLETDNFLSQCPGPETNGLCDDRFRYGADWVSDSVGDTIDQPLGTFEYEGALYTVILSGFLDPTTGELSSEFWSPELSPGDPGNRAYVIGTIVPEPGTAVLLSGGLAGLLVAQRRRRRGREV